MRRPFLASAVFVFSLVATSGAPALAQQPAQSPAPAAARTAADIPTPEQQFGFRMGADGKLADWSQLTAYYRLIAERSPRVQLKEMGPSTLGKPFLVLFVSSPGNLARLEELRLLNLVLADPRGHSEAEIQNAIENGRAIVAQSYGLHATEVAATQTAAELVYDMATRDDPAMRRILDQDVAILFPSLNPDGTTMVAEWVRKTAGTEWQGASLPWLYHPYIGHDNNRDAFQQNTAESVWTGEVLFRDWVPEAYVDHHQMGAYGPRMYVPPYAEPIRPDGDPLVWREMSWWGARIAADEEAAGRQGVANAAIYGGWGHFGFHWITPFHNIAGMLTESASANLAWPIFIQPDQLEADPEHGIPEYRAQNTFPDPWPGGWWTVRDIVDMQKIASLALLDMAAKNRRTVLENHYLKARRQIERGDDAEPVHNGPTGPVAAFIIPADQHDRLTAGELMNKLLQQGIEVRRATTGFVHEGRVYGAGSWVVSMAQPKRGLVRWLLGRTFYPDNAFTRDRGGNPIRPYDLATHDMAEFMGVEAIPVATPVSAATMVIKPRFDVQVVERLPYVTTGIEPEGSVEAGAHGYRLDGRENAVWLAVNRLLDRGVRVRRVGAGSGGADASNSLGHEELEGNEGHEGISFRTGDFLIPGEADAAALREIAGETHVAFEPLDTDPASTSLVKRQRIGLYHRYYGGNMDEGWTRLVLERFGFPYQGLDDARIRKGNLVRDFDVVILPSDNPMMMKGPGSAPGQLSGRYARYLENTPPEYRSGFGDEGVKALDQFVRDGGTLMTFGQAGDLAIDGFNLPVRSVTEGLSSKEFWCPGSMLRVNVDTTDPLVYGMPAHALVLFTGDSRAYETVPGDHSERVHRIITFPEAGEGTDQENILQSGWLIGEDVLSEKAAMVSVDHGQGTVVLIGFRPQHRGQTWGTFGALFGALVGGG